MTTASKTRKWMTSKKAGIVIGIIAVGAFLLALLLFVQPRVEPELLIVWDKQENDCSLWIVNPHKQQTISLPGREGCRYAIVPIDGRQRLIYVEKYPAVITLFNVSKKGLTVDEEIILEGIEITSIPQWPVNDKMYFSAIEEDQEAIYAYTIRTGLVEKLIEYQEGFAYEPVLSPNGKQFVYWVRDGLVNRYQCIMGECRGNYYYLADLEKQTQTALVSLIENPQPHTHCHPMWSPSGRFFAFQIGCDTFPNQIIVFDTAWNKVLIVVDPSPGEMGVDLIGWLSDTELVYRGNVFIQEYNNTFTQHQILSTETLSSELLANLPVRTPDDNIFDLYWAKWAEDGQRIAAIGPGSFYTTSLVIVDVRGQIVQQFPFDRLRTFWHIVQPIWSDSGQYIAYISAETLDSDVAIVNILDRDGRVIYSEKLSQVTRLEFGWLTP